MCVCCGGKITCLKITFERFIISAYLDISVFFPSNYKWFASNCVKENIIWLKTVWTCDNKWQLTRCWTHSITRSLAQCQTCWDHASMIQCYTTVSDYYNSDLRTWTLSPSQVRVMRLESTTLGSLTGPGVLEQEHMKYLNWLGFLIVTRQKYCPKS